MSRIPRREKQVVPRWLRRGVQRRLEARLRFRTEASDQRVLVRPTSASEYGVPPSYEDHPELYGTVRPKRSAPRNAIIPKEEVTDESEPDDTTSHGEVGGEAKRT